MSRCRRSIEGLSAGLDVGGPFEEAKCEAPQTFSWLHELEGEDHRLTSGPGTSSPPGSPPVQHASQPLPG